MLSEAGYRPGNIDAVIIAQKPKFRPYIDEMAENIAGVLKMDRTDVNIKATTEEGLGFTGTDSCANFVFVKHPDFPGEVIAQKLREKGFLIRHFNKERIKDYNRITIGTEEEMEALVEALREITGHDKNS
jgi:histidinol-phosphate/aromatic aminotransferase/cobyric acid decarboxylase-like protein